MKDFWSERYAEDLYVYGLLPNEFFFLFQRNLFYGDFDINGNFSQKILGLLRYRMIV